MINEAPAPWALLRAYLRVSTDEQVASGAGLMAQRTAIQAEAGPARVDSRRVEGRQGGFGQVAWQPSSPRPLRVESHRAATLVVAKLDRLSRSLVDFAGLMDRARAKRWNLVALDLGVDLSTPAGEFLASVAVSAAQ